jgi:4-diphosphocytidyl-2-C-methyl-D-erythritol kinase
MVSGTKIKLFAPAKVNLFLEVINKRDDGYHNIITLMQTIALYDKIELILTDSEIEFECDWSNISKEPVCKPYENLAYRIAVELKKVLREKKGAKINLKKYIPAGAGLGGGSSDCASVLKGLLKLWGRRMATDQLEKIAVKFGSDIPFFLYGGCCLCENIGEKITEISPYWVNKQLSLILIYPGFSISTATIYRNMNNIPRKYHKINISECKNKNFFKQLGFNRLEKIVFKLYPELQKIKQELINSGAEKALVSGSGSTVFGIFNEYGDAKNTLNRLRKKYDYIRLVKTII